MNGPERLRVAPDGARSRGCTTLTRVSAVLFCVQCGSALTDRVPELDTRVRRVCPGCGFVAYQNPKIAAGTVPVHDGRIALIRRAVAPGAGLWSWPSGYVEIDETVEDAAVRETLEETGLTVELGHLLGIFSFPWAGEGSGHPPAGIVVVGWLAAVEHDALRAGDDAEDAGWFRPRDVPWERLAFASSHLGVRRALELHPALADA